jgi:FAD/FMN-containing dehydrogenase/Fe-S oxidoreductase
MGNHAVFSFDGLSKRLDGELYTDRNRRIMYATDASPYRELPIAVAVPRTVEDLRAIIGFAGEHRLGIIPRGAGTSLAGQVVGSGLVVDISRYFKRILAFDAAARSVVVEPGVVLNELNQFLKPHGLFFAPETSTASRCTIGGMLGNNSCGLHSVIYGSTRHHTLAVTALLSDGSTAVFESLDEVALSAKCRLDDLEGRIYRKLVSILENPRHQQEIRREFPDRTLPRKNTGYALDELLETAPFTPGGDRFNLCRLLAGSEGTLAIATAIKLNLVPLPPPVKGLLCVHFRTLEEALEANLIALDHQPGAVELMDDRILTLTAGNILQNRNRFFVQGHPGAILIIEFARDSREEIEAIAKAVEADMRAAGLGYHFPLVFGADLISRVWALRRSALGVLSNLPGDAKPVTVIEDTALHPRSMPAYIAEFKQILNQYGLSCVFHAHIGSGELHFRPILNLKDATDVSTFRSIAVDVARLVKKYNGSLSGEHGDGRLRGEFIPLIIGEHNYGLLREIKATFDPHAILNPGKVIDAPRMNTQLRYLPGQPTRSFETCFDFSAVQGMVRAIEKCNGSGDCKNTPATGKVMCPSYQATMDEAMTTRARANLMRELLSDPSDPVPFASEDIRQILDHCLSCKACKSECPAGVDMTRLKAEFLQHYHDQRGVRLRDRLISHLTQFNHWGSKLPRFYNAVVTGRLTAPPLKRLIGFTPQRQLPTLHAFTLKSWANRHLSTRNAAIPQPIGQVCFFNDEFSNTYDVDIAILTVELLTRLGYRVVMTEPIDSGRALLSKGFVRRAQRLVVNNVRKLGQWVGEDCPLVGLDPSTVLTLRDEYPDLAGDPLKETAATLAKRSFLIEEFLAAEMKRGAIATTMFTSAARKIYCHGHCHQKALTSIAPTLSMLSFPENFDAEEINAGCCGMAGAFGFEKEHYELSVRIAELQLLPAIRRLPADAWLAAPGLSCRQQIRDLTGKTALHPVAILHDALIDHRETKDRLEHDTIRPQETND